MERTERAAAPESGSEGKAFPDFEDLEADAEIAALMEFEPVPRKVNRGNGWTPEVQRRFVAYVAALGSRSQAANAVSREVAGASKLCQSEGGDAFRAACDAALDLYQQRRDARAAANRGGAWAEPLRSRSRRADGPLPGQMRNEYGEWEDEESIARRADEARDRLADKLLRCRRLFLQEISFCAGKRAAFEILTELPVDWDRAARCEPQPHEPWRSPSERKPDNVLLAESGWSLGEIGYGPDKKAALRRALDEYHAEHGLEPIDWSESEGE